MVKIIYMNLNYKQKPLNYISFNLKYTKKAYNMCT